MNRTKINRFLILLLCVIMAISKQANAQKTYFVYLQSDNQQPFYVTLNGKNVPSSAIGYIILSKLVDSTYPIKIGFPGNNQVHEFNIKIEGNDQGYMIKDFGEKGYGLFNLQSMAIEMSSNEANKLKAALALQKAEADKKTADSLALAAAEVAATQRADSIANTAALEQKRMDDSTGLVLATENEKTAVAEKLKEEEARVKAESDLQAKLLTDEQAKAEADAKAKAMAAETKEASKTIEATKDTTAGSTQSAEVSKPVVAEKAVDTIALVKETIAKEAITPPADSTAKEAMAGPETQADSITSVSSVVNAPVAAEKKAITDTVISTRTPRFLDMELSADTTGFVATKTIDNTARTFIDTLVKTPVDTPKVQTERSKTSTGLTSNNSNTVIVTVPEKTSADNAAAPLTNSACKQNASEKDFFNLRKKMVATTEAPEMVLIAKKAFKEKCYSTLQVRNLCVLFLDDASKYNFLDQVYDFTYDQHNYKQLSDLLKEDYYVRRFNAMLK